MRMRSRAHIEGHPIHPMLIPFPFAYLFGAACVDLAAYAADRPRWHPTARHMRIMGIGAALVAAVPGIIDYFLAVPPNSSASERATYHGVANLAAVGVMSSVAATDHDGGRPRPWQIAAQLGAAGVMGIAGYLGGTLVYRNQIGVDHRYADAGKWKERTQLAPAGSLDLDVAAADDLEVNQMELLHVGKRRVVLARTEEGFVAFDDRCTHKGGPLSDGTLACGTVQCPWHGSQFNVRTGQVQHGPAEHAITVHDVVERDGRVWLRLAS
jgi:nitrite reductase/ring-hydroxylating ferredoxin subunit/uncharacterized membrane protein